MKSIIKFILSFICYIVFLPLSLTSTIFLTWYILPDIQTTPFGLQLCQWIGKDLILLTTILICSMTVIFFVLGKIFVVIKNSKPRNFYTHLVTWLIAIMLVVEAFYTFIASDTLHAISIDLDLFRKIGILACGVAMLLYAILAPKVRKLVDRRIQAYDTAKELNAEGRSSVVGM